MSAVHEMDHFTWAKRTAAGVGFGVIVTVVVAWCFALAGASSRPGVRAVGVVRDQTPGVVIRVFDEPRSVGYRLRLAGGARVSVGPDARSVGGAPVIARPGWLPRDFGEDDLLREEHVGWPRLALKSGYGTRTPRGSSTRDARLASLTFRSATTTYTLPITPLWGGFAANVLVYAAVYIGISSAITARRRSRVGRCEKCQYSMAGLPEGAPCPECGTARDGVVA